MTGSRRGAPTIAQINTRLRLPRRQEGHENGRVVPLADRINFLAGIVKDNRRCPDHLKGHRKGQSGPFEEDAPLPAPSKTEALLFRRCREALELSQPAMARALLIAGSRTIGRWEQGELRIPGPAWVALKYLLKERDKLVLADQAAAVGQRRYTAMY